MVSPEEVLSDAIDFFSNLDLRMSAGDFMRKLLEISLNMFPDFDKGSIILKKNGVWKYIAWIGFPDELGKIRATDLYIPQSEDPILVDNIMEKSKDILSKEREEQFKGIGSDKIKKTVSVAIKVNDEIMGGIFLDSTKDVQIMPKLFQSIKAFGKLASVFVAMKLYQEREHGYQRDIIMAMRKAMEARDPYTVGHSERVAKYAVAIAKDIGLNSEEIDRIFWGSVIHDIGKLSVPEHILLKPTKLSDEEYEIVKKHTIVGYSMLEDYPWVKCIRHIVRSHHERWDGKGYPDGLKGKEIPLEVRVVSIADVFDAMTSERIYRKALPVEEVLSEIERQAEKQFDPELAKIAPFILEKMYNTVNRSSL